MDDLDQNLLALLRRDGRATHAQLAASLGVTRATVRTRLDKLEARGDIVGFTVLVKGDITEQPVRALTTLGIEGRGTEVIISKLSGMSSVQAIHSTNGNWDLVVETGTQTLVELDLVLAQIRRLDGVIRSETSILLASKKARKI